MTNVRYIQWQQEQERKRLRRLKETESATEVPQTGEPSTTDEPTEEQSED